MNIIEVLEKAKLYPKKNFAVLPNSEKITYGDLLSTTDKLSVCFHQLNLKQHDKLFLSTNDKKSLVEILIAAYRFGLTVILLDHNSKPGRIHSIINVAQPNAFFIDANLKTEWGIEEKNTVIIRRTEEGKKKFFQKIFSQHNTGIKGIETATDVYPACINLLTDLTPKYPTTIDPSAIAYVMYTSGSTADPKGVAISHHNLFTHLDTLSKVYKFTNEVNILNLLNLNHADGINQGPLLALYNTGTWFCPFKLDTAQLDLIYYSIYKDQITHLFAVPTLLSFFEKYHEGYEDSFQTPDFKFIISVAAQLEERLWNSVSTIFNVRIINVYGLTETVNGSIFCGPAADTFKIGTVGKPVDCEIKIINDNGQEVSNNEKGELLLSGEHIMSGYFNNRLATEEVLANGWLHTGDIAERDDEGFIKIVGRKKSMINSGGFRIQPEEIEEVIMKMEQVDACKVIGMPDKVLIEKLVACIKLTDAAVLNEPELYKFLRENMEPEKVPHEIYFFDELPRGISGKIQEEKLKSMVTGLYREPLEKSKNTLEKIIKTAADTFRVDVDSINELSSSNTISGWDSLNNLVLVTKLEEIFSIEFSTSEIMTMSNIRSIESIINKKIKG